jgi:hypothetical protein
MLESSVSIRKHEQLTGLDYGIDQLAVLLPLDPYAPWVFPVAGVRFGDFMERA